MFGLDFGFSTSTRVSQLKQRERDQKLCEFPPTNDRELFASLLEYVSSEVCSVPVTASLLFNLYSTQNDNFRRFPEHVREDTFYQAVARLADEGAVHTRQLFTFSKMDTVIVSKEPEVLIQLNREHFNERPRQLPEQAVQGLMPQKLDQKIIALRVSEQLRANTLMRQYIIKQAEEERQRKYLATIAQEKLEYGFESLSNEVCQYETRLNCLTRTGTRYCRHKHYALVVTPNNCQPLGEKSKTADHDTCQRTSVELETDQVIPLLKKIYVSLEARVRQRDRPLSRQWINCDLRVIDYTVLGKFDAIMLDPPWDIHMSLPYQTLKDKEMLSLKVKELQDSGICFLWVTGRTLELGRECLTEWGYKQVDELIWVKVAHNKIVRTGRTGHWLNHSKEHCLVGVKGDTSRLNRNEDCDVLVAPVRQTSRKPDEIYDLIERIAPGGRKVELFARPHNRRNGWLSLGNQLPGIYLTEPELLARMRARYPELNLTDEVMIESGMIENDRAFEQAVYDNHRINTLSIQR